MASLTWDSVCRWTQIIYHLQYQCHLQCRDPTNIKLWLFYICSIWSQTSSDCRLCLPKMQVCRKVFLLACFSNPLLYITLTFERVIQYKYYFRFTDKLIGKLIAKFSASQLLVLGMFQRVWRKCISYCLAGKQELF